MGEIIIYPETSVNPISLAGEMAGLCWGADTTDLTKNFYRGVDCIKSGHGRVMEFPQVYLIIDEYSARVIREFERHIGGAPTFLQESTRYVDYSDFKYVIPPSIEKNEKAKEIYDNIMGQIKSGAQALKELGIPREDIGMVCPLGMETKVVHRTNMRNLFDMSKVRKCSRAYWEFRNLFEKMEGKLKKYSPEWQYAIDELKIFRPKCEWLGYCDEKNSCGRKPRKEEDNA